jgi:hypothetical protein
MAELTEATGPLSPAELDEFLARPLLLKLACLRPDGWPYVIPLWFAWYERKLYVVGRERAVWIEYLRREPRVGVLIDEDTRRQRRVQMIATAALVEGPLPRAQGSQRWRDIDRLLVGRYMADASGEAYRQRTAERPRYLVEMSVSTLRECSHLVHFALHEQPRSRVASRIVAARVIVGLILFATLVELVGGPARQAEGGQQREDFIT